MVHGQLSFPNNSMELARAAAARREAGNRDRSKSRSANWRKKLHQ